MAGLCAVRVYVVMQVKASVVPQAEKWPRPDYSKTSLLGDKPHVEEGDAFWGPIRIELILPEPSDGRRVFHTT
jgi:hypothetical protein